MCKVQDVSDLESICFVTHGRCKTRAGRQIVKGYPNRKSTAGAVNRNRIIIMEICKAPTLRLKALNKHNKTHIMYIEIENVSSSLTKKLTPNVDTNKGLSITMFQM